MAIGSMLRPRWLPEKRFPSYAYLPGRQPHPVRDPAGHSYQTEAMPVAAAVSLDSDIFLWGLDLFNHGYYWDVNERGIGTLYFRAKGTPVLGLMRGTPVSARSGEACRGCTA